MDVATVTQFVSSVGFPIACVIMLWYKMNQDTAAHKDEMDNMVAALNNNTLMIQHLSDQLNYGNAQGVDYGQH